MLKLIKYELRGNAFNIFGVCMVVIIPHLFLVLMTDLAGHKLISGLSLCVVAAALALIFISSLRLLSNYLYEEQGYLLFTLPKSGMTLLISRLITALIQIIIITTVAFFTNYLTIAETDSLFLLFSEFNIAELLFLLFESIWLIFYFFTMVYFCMLINKIAFNRKDFSQIGFFISFFILFIGIGWVSVTILDLFSYRFIIIPDSLFTVNPYLWIFNIITFMIFFFTTSHLLEKKIDL